MTTYKEINGTNIEAVSSDPANPVTGQVWYNTTDNVVKGMQLQTTVGAWATGGACNTAGRHFAQGGSGNTNSCFNIMEEELDPVNWSNTESYNGSAWTEVNDMTRAPAGTTGMV